jgi:hypothetical protein
MFVLVAPERIEAATMNFRPGHPEELPATGPGPCLTGDVGAERRVAKL